MTAVGQISDGAIQTIQNDTDGTKNEIGVKQKAFMRSNR
jgi:hypothetical protein